MNVEDKNVARNDGSTPLYWAAHQGHYEICKLIVENVEDKNPARNDGKTPAFIAAKNGHLSICQLILTSVDKKNISKMPKSQNEEIGYDFNSYMFLGTGIIVGLLLQIPFLLFHKCQK